MRLLKVGPRAVFVINNKVKTMFPAGARFDLMCMECPEGFVGVYTAAGAYREFVADDIRATPGYKCLKICELGKT